MSDKGGLTLTDMGSNPMLRGGNTCFSGKGALGTMMVLQEDTTGDIEPVNSGQRSRRLVA
jgi:hypothetical protein